MIPFKAPDWSPTVDPGMRILITGASGGLGRALVDMLLQGPDCRIGAHGASKRHPSNDPRIVHLTKAFNGANDCEALVNEFVAEVGGIDALVVLSGGIHFSGHWKDMPEADWARDMDVNLNQPFFLARAAMAAMQGNPSGGFWSTGSDSATSTAAFTGVGTPKPTPT